MKQVDRQKMCTNCHGRIPLEAEVCPYCSSDLIAQAQTAHPTQAPLFKPLSLQESLSSLYTPPYSSKKGSKAAEQPALQQEMAPEYSSSQDFSIHTASLDAEEEKAVTDKQSFWTMLFLFVASNLLLLGLLQFFFSDRGFLKLEWNSSYWFIYCLLSLPLFYLGIKKINALK